MNTPDIRWQWPHAYAHATAQLEALQAENARLREALFKISGDYGLNHTSKWCRDFAAAALRQGEGSVLNAARASRPDCEVAATVRSAVMVAMSKAATTGQHSFEDESTAVAAILALFPTEGQ